MPMAKYDAVYGVEVYPQYSCVMHNTIFTGSAIKKNCAFFTDFAFIFFFFFFAFATTGGSDQG